LNSVCVPITHLSSVLIWIELMIKVHPLELVAKTFQNIYFINALASA
jgi:hypothetical protein